ncbi:MAG: penicillin-binding protein 1C [Caldilineaceae bacterium]|nr:penicillin-binding protein 1C [Caldilineaceae bacterium]
MNNARFWRRTRVRIVSITALALLVGAGALYWWLFADLPPVSAITQRMARPTTQILDRNGKLLYEVLDPNTGKQIDLDLSHIPEACVQATLATEDSRFFLHPGVDPLAIARAFWQNLSGRTIASGASTLTQQLARNLLMGVEERYEPSYRRKLREAWLALQLELHYTKDELLALYLNQTYYGNFAFGLEAAAQVYFAKPASQLSRAECALLTGLIQFPTGYNPLIDPEAAKGRQLTVLRLMEDAGFLTADEVAQIEREPLQYRSYLFDIEAPHFVMYVQELLVYQLGVDRLLAGGLRVYTTLDLDLQRQAESAVRRRLDQLTCRGEGGCTDPAARSRRVDNAAAVVIDSTTGDILAMVGSPDYFSRQISGNVNAALVRRQPGSAIKPFTYAAALDPRWSVRTGQQPLTAASILPDLPTTFYVTNEDGNTAAYRPQNYDRTYHGPVSVRAALANSYNIPAVELLERVGVETLRDLASQAGIRTFTRRYGLALTLGGGDVRLLELTAAYSILDDGVPVIPQAIVEIKDAQQELYRRHPSSDSTSGLTPVISPQAAYLITDILSDNVARIPAFGASSVLQLPFPVAVKTGTTTDWRDNWTVGYTTKRLVGVWVGNADNSPMVGVSGVDGAGPIWHDLMLLAHPMAPPPFVQPDNLVETEVCAPSGMLPTPECPRTRFELFISGTEPTRPDTQFQRVAIDRATGMPATDSTPPERRVERVYWMLPPEYHDWMVAHDIAIAPPGSQALAADNGTGAVRNAANRAPLVLVAPASYTAYQIHPGLPQENQRLPVNGMSTDGRLWHSLRLMVDGELLATASNTTRIKGWWTMTLGNHRFWLEGEQVAGGSTVRSAEAQIRVEEFQIDQLSAQVP